MRIKGKNNENILWYTVTPFFLHLLRVLNSIILARLILPSEFGLLAVGLVIFHYSNTFTSFGIPNAIINEKYVTDRYYSEFFSFNFLISSVLCSAMFLNAELIGDFFNMEALSEKLKPLALMFLVSSLTIVPFTYHKKKMSFKFLAIAEIIKVFFTMMVSLTLASNGFQSWSIIYATIIANIIYYLILGYSSPLKVQLTFDFSCLRRLLRFSLWDFLWGQTKLLSENFDKLYIGKMIGASGLGYYDKGYGFSKMPYEQLSSRLSVVSFSTISSLYNSNEHYERYFYKSFSINCLIIFPVFMGLLAISEIFTVVLLGELWKEMIPCLQILSIAYLFASLMESFSSLNMATGLIGEQAKIRLISLLIFVFSILFIMPSSIVGMAVCVACLNGLLFVSSLTLSLRKNRVNLSRVTSIIIAPLLISLVMYFVIRFYLEQFDGDYSFHMLGLSTLIGFLVYAFSCFICPFEELDQFKSLLKVYGKGFFSRS